MTKTELFEQIKAKKSFLCIGLDPDLSKIPFEISVEEEPLFVFNKAIIDATHDLCVAYKPNLAFFEAYGSKGWAQLEKTVAYIKETYPQIFIIGDAKRGDIGNTSDMYAKAMFNVLGVDAVTLAPYMGEDSIAPFLKYKGKWGIVLALTSNKGANDFQTSVILDGTKFQPQLYQQVLEKSSLWGNENNMMYVIGATKAEELQTIRFIVPNHFLLVPGVGAQGGSLEEVVKYGINHECGLLVNSSRQILYASSGPDFAEAARSEALKAQQEMESLLKRTGHI